MRHKSSFLFLLLLGFWSVSPKEVCAQVDQDYLIQQVLEYLIENGDESLDYTELQDKLLRFYEHPISLNTASFYELSQLEILGKTEVAAIIKHRETYGNFLSFYELQAVEGVSVDVLRLIKPFVSVSEYLDAEKLSLIKILKRSDAFLLSRTRFFAEEQAGYTKNRINEDDGYLGAPFQWYNRFQYSYGRRFSSGITVEKDMGEPLMNKGVGFDYVSGHIYLSDMGKIAFLALGDYQLQFGQGLNLWSGLAFNKSAQTLNISKRASGVLPYRGVNENLFLRGAAVGYNIKKLRLTAFYSEKNIDGNISASDTLEDAFQSFSSFQISGLHRTQSEIANKKAINEQLIGGNAHLEYKKMNIGATWSQIQYTPSLGARTRTYQQFNFSGSNNQNASLYYSALYKGVYVYGEAAWSQHQNKMAVVQGALMSLAPTVDLAVCYRKYDNGYFAPFSNGFREGSTTANEEGLYLGMLYNHSSKLSFGGYIDRFYREWLTFRSGRPSYGYEYLFDATYKKKRDFEVYFRLKLQQKEENMPSSLRDNSIYLDYLNPNERRNIRIQLRYHKAQPFTFTTRLETSKFSRDGTDNYGYLIYQDVSYKPSFTKISFITRYALFNVDGFDSRIYAYENDVLYGYSIPFFYRQGFRFYFLSRIRFSRSIDVWLRYARTEYRNVEGIGSGNEYSEGNSRNEFKIQVRIKF